MRPLAKSFRRYDFLAACTGTIFCLWVIQWIGLKEWKTNDRQHASFMTGAAEQSALSTSNPKPENWNSAQKLTTGWNHSHQARSKETAIVMYDTRSLKVDVNSSYVYWRWAAELNFHYARRHDYDFYYIQGQRHADHNSSQPEGVNATSDGVNSIYKTRAQCVLDMPSKNLTVERGASWCKLIGLASIFERGYSTVVFIDSDAFFQLDAPSIDTLVQERGILGKTNSTPLVWFPVNDPFHHDRPNAALHIWLTTSSSAWRLLRQWWQLNKSPQRHSFEQDALWEIIGCPHFTPPNHTKMEVCGVGLLDVPHMRMEMHNKLPVVHVASHNKNMRERIMRPEFNKIHNGSDDEVFSKVVLLSAEESTRLQRILADESNNVAC